MISTKTRLFSEEEYTVILLAIFFYLIVTVAETVLDVCAKRKFPSGAVKRDDDRVERKDSVDSFPIWPKLGWKQSTQASLLTEFDGSIQAQNLNMQHAHKILSIAASGLYSETH